MSNLCEVCDIRPGTKYCNDCPRTKLYCDDCLDRSHKSDARKEHKIQDYKPEADRHALPLVVFCTKHTKEEKKYCCLKCNESICGECATLGNHKGHEITSIQDGLDKKSKEFNSLLPKYEKTLKLGIEHKGSISEYISKNIGSLKKTRTETNKNFQILEEAITKKKSEVFGLIDSVIDVQTKSKQVIDGFEAKTKKAIDDCVSIIDKRSNFICASYDFIGNKLLELKEASTMIETYLPLKGTNPPNYKPIQIEKPLEAINEIKMIREEIAFENLGDFLRSNIIKRPEDLQLMYNWMTEDKKRQFTAKLLWRGSTEGYGASVFHSKCDNKGPTLTLIQSTNGNIFGGFISVPWHCKESYAYDPTAFLFSLSKKVKCKEQLDTNCSMYGKSDFGPTFGFSHDIIIRDNCNATNFNFSHGNITYKLPEGVDQKSFYAGSYNFTVKEIEVYSIIYF